MRERQIEELKLRPEAMNLELNIRTFFVAGSGFTREHLSA